ncbi:EF-hand domain-containing protein [Sphingomonas morindae]|uniref:EF-hand domain-containing protein n=1 Tax=Sphingomonas morindae TaxID=1541170 RepID=A0ABY4X4J3_9SPHN|nr:hypothetical protein [Sphingomonas morindae]USI71826.1 hypothetical protein LHA26_10890 [Sphingomonas morindae]
MMRIGVAALALALAGPAIAAEAPPLEGGATFISPMGEPFRSTDGLSGAEHWFREADADHDGRITREEMRADAERFFKKLDQDGDGEIGPDEITRYETEIAPEIRVASTMGDMSLAKTDDQGNVTPPPYPTRLGAGRFGYLDMPEPIITADTNMDRAITRAEFDTAAFRRFKMLDTDGDGAITRAELPKLSAKAATSFGHGHGGGGGGGRGGRGHGRH